MTVIDGGRHPPAASSAGRTIATVAEPVLDHRPRRGLVGRLGDGRVLALGAPCSSAPATIAPGSPAWLTMTASIVGRLALAEDERDEPGDDERGDEQQRDRRPVAPDLLDHASERAPRSAGRSSGHRHVGAELRGTPARDRRCRPARGSRAGVPRAMTLPERMNRSSSHRSASSMTWLDTTIVVPASASARKWVQNWTRRSGSTPTVGSSRNRTGGRWTRAQASDSRRRCPPDSVPAIASPRSAELDELEGGLDGARVPDPVRRREEPRVLADGQREVDPVGLGHVADPGSDSAGTASRRRGPRPARSSPGPGRSAAGSGWSCPSRSGRAGRRSGRARGRS